MPKTKLGKWSVRLIATFFVLLGIFFLLVKSGQRGGMGFFDNLWLAIPGLGEAFTGIAAFFTGIVALVKDKERSLLVFVSTAIGAFVLWFVSMEILFPH